VGRSSSGFSTIGISLGPGDELTFGRRADLVIDENPFLHR